MDPKEVVERSKPSALAMVRVHALRGSLGTTVEAAGAGLVGGTGGGERRGVVDGVAADHERAARVPGRSEDRRRADGDAAEGRAGGGRAAGRGRGAARGKRERDGGEGNDGGHGLTGRVARVQSGTGAIGGRNQSHTMATWLPR